jgi:hypothetical protein
VGVRYDCNTFTSGGVNEKRSSRHLAESRLLGQNLFFAGQCPDSRLFGHLTASGKSPRSRLYSNLAKTCIDLNRDQWALSPVVVNLPSTKGMVHRIALTEITSHKPTYHYKSALGPDLKKLIEGKKGIANWEKPCFTGSI